MLSTLWPAHGNFRRHRAHLSITEDVPYSTELPEHPKLRFDVFAPLKDPAFPPPAVLFLHGGGWAAEDRQHYRAVSGLYSNVGAAFARAGFVGVVAGYRQAPEATLPLAIEDVRTALRAWGSRAAGHGADPSRVVLMGHGSGGHLALAVAMLGGDAMRSVRAVISLAGFYDIERTAQALPGGNRSGFDAYCGAEPSVAAALSPERRVRDLSVPVMLGVGDKDSDALRAEHDAMERALREVLKPAESFLVHGCGHRALVRQMGSEHDAVTPLLVAFARARTGA